MRGVENHISTTVSYPYVWTLCGNVDFLWSLKKERKKETALPPVFRIRHGVGGGVAWGGGMKTERGKEREEGCGGGKSPAND